MKQELIMRTEKQRQEDRIWKLVDEYLGIFERTEEYERCSLLKKAFEKLEQFK